MNSASSALLTAGNVMGRMQARFKRFSEGQGFGFTAERHSVLIQADLPAGCCQFFYQDLHC